MQHPKQWLVLVALLGSAFSACANASEAGPPSRPPAIVEDIAATGEKRITLTAKAAQRLAIATVPVREEWRAGWFAPQRVVPSAAVIYDVRGETSTYTSPNPLTFVRKPIRIERIEGQAAILSDGPPVGMAVVIVGAAELYGVESEIGH